MFRTGAHLWKENVSCSTGLKLHSQVVLRFSTSESPTSTANWVIVSIPS